MMIKTEELGTRVPRFPDLHAPLLPDKALWEECLFAIGFSDPGDLKDRNGAFGVFGGEGSKRKTAKEILAESFREVAGQKDIDRITVRDITENCGYSPATFYRQFKDKYDLISWDYTRELKDILSRVDGSKAEWQKALICAANFFQERKTYLANLFLHTSGLESFLTNMQEVNFECLKDAAEKSSGGQPMDAFTAMLVRQYVLGSSRFTCEWILGKWKADAEDLAAVYEQTLPLPFQKVLR